jgi:hypothetical protein
MTEITMVKMKENKKAKIIYETLYIEQHEPLKKG